MQVRLQRGVTSSVTKKGVVSSARPDQRARNSAHCLFMSFITLDKLERSIPMTTDAEIYGLKLRFLFFAFNKKYLMDSILWNE